MRAVQWIRKPSQAIIWLLVSAVVTFIAGASFLPEVSFVSAGLVLMPLILLLSSALGGPIAALGSLAIFGGTAYWLFGPGGLWLVAYLAPPVLIFLVCLELQVPFFKTAGILALTYTLCALLIYVLLQRLTGGQLFESVAQAAIKGLDGFPARDNLLDLLWRMGLLQAAPNLEAGQAQHGSASGILVMTPEVIEQFYRQIDTRIRLLLSSLLPGLLTTNPLHLSLLGSGLALKLAARYQTAPTLGMPPFSTWHLNKEIGRYMLALALGYLLALFSTNPLLSMTGQLMYNVFFALFSIQGMAYANYLLKRRGTRRGFRIALLLILFLLQPIAMVVLMMGIFDQLRDPRKLREPANPA